MNENFTFKRVQKQNEWQYSIPTIVAVSSHETTVCIEKIENEKFETINLCQILLISAVD